MSTFTERNYYFLVLHPVNSGVHIFIRMDFISFQLLTVNPAENSLALVYRDKDTLKFVKHINNRINEMQNDKEFFDIALTYFE